jgi:hypothetical protein
MDSSDTARPSWAETKEEYRQLTEEILERIRQRMGIRPNGQFWSFAQREALAEELGREVGGFLLEKGIALDSALPESTQAEKADCPYCHRSVSRAKDKSGKPRTEHLLLETKVGKVPVETALYCCWKCRRVFSPYGKPSSSGRHPLQQQPAAKNQLGRRKLHFLSPGQPRLGSIGRYRD